MHSALYDSVCAGACALFTASTITIISIIATTIRHLLTVIIPTASSDLEALNNKTGIRKAQLKDSGVVCQCVDSRLLPSSLTDESLDARTPQIAH